jgi:hypothetical protein
MKSRLAMTNLNNFAELFELLFYIHGLLKVITRLDRMDGKWFACLY